MICTSLYIESKKDIICTDDSERERKKEKRAKHQKRKNRKKRRFFRGRKSIVKKFEYKLFCFDMLYYYHTIIIVIIITTATASGNLTKYLFYLRYVIMYVVYTPPFLQEP